MIGSKQQIDCALETEVLLFSRRKRKAKPRKSLRQIPEQPDEQRIRAKD